MCPHFFSSGCIQGTGAKSSVFSGVSHVACLLWLRRLWSAWSDPVRKVTTCISVTWWLEKVEHLHKHQVCDTCQLEGDGEEAHGCFLQPIQQSRVIQKIHLDPSTRCIAHRRRYRNENKETYVTLGSQQSMLVLYDQTPEQANNLYCCISPCLSVGQGCLSQLCFFLNNISVFLLIKVIY